MLELSDAHAGREITVRAGARNESNPLPTSTKVMVEQPGEWYVKFSRNILVLHSNYDFLFNDECGNPEGEGKKK